MCQDNLHDTARHCELEYKSRYVTVGVQVTIFTHIYLYTYMCTHVYMSHRLHGNNTW